MQNYERLFPAKESWLILGISRSAMYKMLNDPQTPTVKIGRRVLLPGWFIKKLLETGKVAG